MKEGRFWGAAVAGGVTLFLVGFVLWGLVFEGFYAAHAGTATGVVREEMDFFHLALGQFFWAVLLGMIIKSYAGVTGFVQGLKIGASVGFLAFLSVGLTQLSMTHLLDVTLAMVDPFVEAVWSGLGGGVIGLVLAGGAKPSEA